MPTPTYTPLANITLGSAASSVTFSSITAGYRDLILIATFSQTASSRINHIFNGETSATNYSYVDMYGDGTTASSSTASGNNKYIDPSASALSTQVTIHIMDAFTIGKQKTSLIRFDRVGLGTSARATRWANTAAITSYALNSNTSTFTAGSTFALYGVAA